MWQTTIEHANEGGKGTGRIKKGLVLVSLEAAEDVVDGVDVREEEGQV